MAKQARRYEIPYEVQLIGLTVRNGHLAKQPVTILAGWESILAEAVAYLERTSHYVGYADVKDMRKLLAMVRREREGRA